MGKISSMMEKLCNLANSGYFLIITLFIFLILAGLISTSIQFSEYAYYYTLSSIFQGLFSILALAGIFVIFRIEQLSKDEAKYETDFKEYLSRIKNQQLPYSLTGGVLDSFKYILEWNENDAILKLLDERKFKENSEELNKLKQKIENESTKIEEEYRELKHEIEENERNPAFSRLNFTSIENVDRNKLETTDALKNCLNNVKECEKKGILIHKNRIIKSKLLELFKIPFISGMILIAFTIYFLPMINSNSKLGLHMPGNLVIGCFVSLTIMVILEIIILIYYSMWSDEAKNTLI